MAKNNNAINVKQYNRAISLSSTGRQRSEKRIDILSKINVCDEKGRKVYQITNNKARKIKYFDLERFEIFYGKCGKI